MPSKQLCALLRPVGIALAVPSKQLPALLRARADERVDLAGLGWLTEKLVGRLLGPFLSTRKLMPDRTGVLPLWGGVAGAATCAAATFDDMQRVLEAARGAGANEASPDMAFT